MKNAFFILMFLGFVFISCRGNEENPQQIDQVVNLYIKDATGKDLLDTKLSGAFNNIKFLDLNGLTDQVPISSFSLKKNLDTVNYIDYDSGAKRILQDSLNPGNKTYRSNFILSLSKNIDATTAVTTQDTIKIEYSWTPALFQISKFYYNKKLVFSKVSGKPNVITIIK
ncbi:hypothetical protein [Halpernia sp. GG3]